MFIPDSRVALKLIQHVVAIGSIRNLDTRLYFAINLVNFLALKLIQHVIAIGSIEVGSPPTSLQNIEVEV